MQGKITFVEIKRSTLILGCDTDEIYLQKKGELEIIKPSFCTNTDGIFQVWFNLASCFEGRCLPDGLWQVVGAEADGIEDFSADFSKGSCQFAIDCIVNGSTLYVNCLYTPTKTGLRDKITTFGLRAPYVVGKLLRGGKRRVLFASETRASLSGNMEQVIKAADDFGGNRVLYSFKKGSRLAYYLKTAFLMGLCHTVVVDDYFPLVYRINFKADRAIQIWHACGAFKTVGYSRLGKSGAPQPDDITHRNYSLVTVSGEEVIPFYAEAFGISADKIVATGVPRTDIFFDEGYGAQKRTEFFERYPFAKGKQVLLFAPTFRGDGFNSAHYPKEYIDFEGLGEFCRQKGWVIIFKMHPFVKDFAIPQGYEDVFADGGDMREINDMLFAADLLITDYSSVIYEYSLLDKPLIFYTPDMDDYCQKRDLYMPFDRYARGKAVFSSEALLSCLNKGDFAQFECQHIRQGSMSACKGDSAKNVANLIFYK